MGNSYHILSLYNHDKLYKKSILHALLKSMLMYLQVLIAKHFQ